MKILGVVAVLPVAVGLAAARPAEAQAVEVIPAIGYRAGVPSFVYGNREGDAAAGGVSFGVAVDVRYAPDRAVEGLFSRQVAEIVFRDVSNTPSRVRCTVDYWHGGGIREFGAGRVRPFLAGTLGLTRYGQAGSSFYRFSVGAGGGVKLWPSPHVGVRLDARLYTTIVAGDTTVGICGGGGCILYISAGAAWQADFSAGLVFAF